MRQSLCEKSMLIYTVISDINQTVPLEICTPRNFSSSGHSLWVQIPEGEREKCLENIGCPETLFRTGTILIFATSTLNTCEPIFIISVILSNRW